MGIRNSYKAFVGVEFSLGKLWSSKACFSVDRKVEPTNAIRKSDYFDEHSQADFVPNSNDPSSHIEDAVYAIISSQNENDIKEGEFLKEYSQLQKNNAKLQAVQPKHIRTYLQNETTLNYPKGRFLDLAI